MSAADSWRQQLEDWKIPDALLAAVEESPYGWSQKLWKRRAARAVELDRSSPTLDLVRDLADGGSVLDVGAGTGRASLPLVRDGYRVTMVEPNQAMRAGLAELKAEYEFEVVEGRWPAVAGEVEPHAVALSAHVVYDVAEVAPFLEALDQTSTRGVVLEMTPAHPWVNLGPLYRELHGLDRPLGPTVDDLAAVVREAVGTEPVIHRWSRPTDMVFDTVEEAIEFTAQRLVLPRGRWPELEERLLPRLTGRAGHWQIEPTERELCTLWWRSNSPQGWARSE